MNEHGEHWAVVFAMFMVLAIPPCERRLTMPPTRCLIRIYSSYAALRLPDTDDHAIPNEWSWK
jgi:hypothetical protein